MGAPVLLEEAETSGVTANINIGQYDFSVRDLLDEIDDIQLRVTTIGEAFGLEELLDSLNYVRAEFSSSASLYWHLFVYLIERVEWRIGF